MIPNILLQTIIVWVIVAIFILLFRNQIGKEAGWISNTINKIEAKPVDKPALME
jgi:hypothetical protein